MLLLLSFTFLHAQLPVMVILTSRKKRKKKEKKKKKMGGGKKGGDDTHIFDDDVEGCVDACNNLLTCLGLQERKRPSATEAAQSVLAVKAAC